MRTAVAVEHGEVQHVVMDTAHAEAVLVLLPETQDGRTADPGQADLRGAMDSSSIHTFIRSSIFVFGMEIIVYRFR